MFFFLVTSKGILQQIRNIDVRKDMVAKKKKKANVSVEDGKQIMGRSLTMILWRHRAGTELLQSLLLPWSVIKVSSCRPSADMAHLLFQPGLCTPVWCVSGVWWRGWNLSLFCPSETAGSLPRELKYPCRTPMQTQLTPEFYLASSDIEMAEECLENGHFPWLVKHFSY